MNCFYAASDSSGCQPAAHNKPDAAAIKSAMDKAFAVGEKTEGGKNADYIPALATVDPKLFSLVVADPEGNIYTLGDADYEFAIESISKVFTMALAMMDVGAKAFHSKVGASPTGLGFNSVMALELHNDLPMSPLVNAGAMSSASLVKAKDKEERWQRILDIQSKFAGRQIKLSDVVNESEQSTNFHNRAIAWLLQTGGAMYSDPMDACEVYTRQCSTLINTRDLAIMGATLAAHGKNPVSGDQVIPSELVPHILAEMTMEGLYTASGDWSYDVGLPAKSGVGGGILAVSPGTLSIAAFSPPLDGAGNSVKAQAAVAAVAKELGLNLYL